MGVLGQVFQQLATTLIGTFSDVPATYTRTPTPSYDETTGQEFRPPSTSYSIKITPPTAYHRGEVNGTTVQSHDLRAYISAADLPITPDPRTDSLTWMGRAFQLISSNPLGDADVTVLVELQLRA